MRRFGFLRQRIEKNVEDKGQIVLLAGLFFSVFLAVLLMAQLQLEEIRASNTYMEDALAASGLACALVDIREYGRSHRLVIPDPIAAYGRYCVALQANLGLDETWECGNRHLIRGKVTVVDYCVFNVRGDLVTTHRLQNGIWTTQEGRLGTVSAPNGQVIERTGVYGEISYPYQGVFGNIIQARHGKLVDIVGE